MKIELSQEEYQLLLEMVCTADYVYSVYFKERDQDREKYHTVQQKIMSYANLFKRGSLVKWDEKSKQFIPSDEFYEEVSSIRFIEEFEINTFWEQLIERLAMRDLFNHFGEDKVQQMDDKEFFQNRSQFREKYEEEFEKNGIQNIIFPGIIKK